MDSEGGWLGEVLLQLSGEGAEGSSLALAAILSFQACCWERIMDTSLCIPPAVRYKTRE